MLYIDTNTFSLGKYIHSPKANDAEKYFSLQPNCDYIAAKTQHSRHWAAVAAMFTNNGGIKSVSTGLCFCVHRELPEGDDEWVKLFKSKLIWFLISQAQR